MMRDLVGHARAIIAPSGFAADSLCKYFGLPAEMVSIIGHGCFVSKRTARKQIATDGRLRLGVIGHLHGLKGVAAAIEALSFLSREVVDLELIGVLDARSRELARRHSVRVSGPYTHGQLPAILEHIDLTLFAPDVRETYCLTLDEVLACLVPAVVVRKGALVERLPASMRHWVLDNGAPRKIADAIRKLEQNRGLLQAVSDELMESWSPNSWESAALQYDALYHGACRGSS